MIENPRFYKMSQNYALTITLNPRYRTIGSIEQFDQTGYRIGEILASKFPHCKLTLIAEFTKSYDIHYHGVISFDISHILKDENLCLIFRDTFRKDRMIGYVLLKPIDNQPVWNEYIRKDYIETKKYLGGKNPVIIDDYNIFGQASNYFEYANENDDNIVYIT